MNRLVINPIKRLVELGQPAGRRVQDAGCRRGLRGRHGDDGAACHHPKIGGLMRGGTSINSIFGSVRVHGRRGKATLDIERGF